MTTITLPAQIAASSVSLGAGLAWVGSGGSLGASIGYYDSQYGVPTRPGMHHHHEEGEDAEEEHGAEGVSIGLEQIRADLRGSLDLGNGVFSELTTRWAYSDYTHTEFEGDEIGTTFTVPVPVHEKLPVALVVTGLALTVRFA